MATMMKSLTMMNKDEEMINDDNPCLFEALRSCVSGCQQLLASGGRESWETGISDLKTRHQDNPPQL